MQKIDDAIYAYKRTISAQEAQAEPLDEFAATYLELARLYQSDYAPSRAARVLEKGLVVFPENLELRDELNKVRPADAAKEGQSRHGPRPNERQ